MSGGKRFKEGIKHLGLAWNAFTGRRGPVPFQGQLKPEHRVDFAFELDGVKHFEFGDIHNMPCARAFSALAFYEELRMRCSREFLQAHCQAVEDTVNSKAGISITTLARLNQQLKERLEMIFEPELVYKLASVVYFDESESPYSYDFKYGLEKIARWKKHKLADFFLSQPIKKLIPQIDLSAADLEESSRIMKLINKEHLEFIFTTVSASSRKKELFSLLESQMRGE